MIENDDATCLICGQTETLHNGMHKFCPTYPAFRAASRAVSPASAAPTCATCGRPIDIRETGFVHYSGKFHYNDCAPAVVADAAGSSGAAPSSGAETRDERARETDERASDYRAGYSAGYEHARSGKPRRDEESALIFFNRCPAWELLIPYVDEADDDPDFACRLADETVYALDEATAIERATEQLLARVPSAFINGDITVRAARAAAGGATG